MYRIEITADTLAELAGKALSLAAKLNTGTATEAPVPVKGATSAKIDPVMPEVAEAAPAPEPTPEPTPPASASEPEVSSETLRALVLKLVASKGREACEEVLSRFGVAKASDIDAERASELAAALEDAL